jgi:hypothetical protein
MAKETFYIGVMTAEAATFYAFSRSETGILDFNGTATPSASELSQMQSVEGSRYFTPSWYTYLPQELQAEILVYIPANIDNMDAGQYSFLLHVGALLLAVQVRDGLLTAELLRRRSMVFANFTPLVLHIVKPIAAEALFARIYGGFTGEGEFKQVYQTNAAIATGETDVSAILFAAARDSLKPEPEKESPEEMFIRYFRECGNADLTIGIVGASCHPWIDGVEKFGVISDAAISFHFGDDPYAAGKKQQELFASLKAMVQAEPYNPHDHNAICVSIDDLESVLKGIPSKSKAGYIRATAAAILRKARPNLFSYGSKLWRLGANPEHFENSIVMRLKF